MHPLSHQHLENDLNAKITKQINELLSRILRYSQAWVTWVIMSCDANLETRFSTLPSSSGNFSSVANMWVFSPWLGKYLGKKRNASKNLFWIWNAQILCTNFIILKEGAVAKLTTALHWWEKIIKIKKYPRFAPRLGNIKNFHSMEFHRITQPVKTSYLDYKCETMIMLLYCNVL